MPAKYDLVNVLPPRLNALGISTNLFGRYVGLPSSSITQMLAGKKRISNVRNTEFSGLIRDLERVANAFAPAPVDFKEIERVRQIIKDLKDGSLIVCVLNRGTYHTSSSINPLVFS
jgi:hypothetical protein